MATSVIITHNHGTIRIEGEEVKEICCECGRREKVFGGYYLDVKEVKNINRGSVIVMEKGGKWFVPNDVTITDDVFGEEEDTFLHFSSSWNIKWMVQRILKEKILNADVMNRRGETAIIWACEKGHPGIVKVLLDHGASVFTKDNGNRAALYFAVRSESVDIVKLLVEHGADVNAKDWRGRTVLHEVVHNPPSSVLAQEYLLSLQQCNLEDDGCYANTPLMWAIRGLDSTMDIIQRLIQAGSKILYSDGRIWSPLHVVFEDSVKDEVKDFVFSNVCEEKNLNKEELLEWMLHPPFSDATDVDGWNWIFLAFKYNINGVVLNALLSLGDDVPFSTIGPFGIQLDTVIYRGVKDKQIYKDRKEEIDKLLVKLRNKSYRDLISKPNRVYLSESFNAFVDSVKKEKNNPRKMWKVMEAISSSLSVDWLVPVTGISYTQRYSKEGPYITSILSPQVQLSINPYTSYKEVLKMHEGQSLLHVAAENGNEMAVHLILLLGAKNVQDMKNRLPYQCAHEKGYHHLLGQFIIEYYEIEGVEGLVTEEDENWLMHNIESSIGWTFNLKNVKLFSEIPQVNELTSQIKELKLESANGMSESGNNGKVMGVTKDKVKYFEMEGYKQIVDKTISERFEGSKRIFTDGSCKPIAMEQLDQESERETKKRERRRSVSAGEYSGAAYYDEDSNTGTGYPIQPAEDIHISELLAVKIALEEVACNKDAVFLTDRQPMVKVLQKLLDDWYEADANTFLLNWIILSRLMYPPNPLMKYGLQWVKAHVGIKGNEMADTLANVTREKGRLVLSKEVEGEVKNRLEQEKMNTERTIRNIISEFKME